MLLEEWTVEIPLDVFKFKTIEQGREYAIYLIREAVDWRTPSKWDSWLIDEDDWNVTFCVTRLSRLE